MLDRVAHGWHAPAAMRVAAFIQARMTSRRFPGKVLAPLHDRPLIDWVLDAVREGVPNVEPLVLTSDHASDDPLAAHLAARGVRVFRGPLENVLGRFVACLATHPVEAVLRICGDSPLVSPDVLARVVARAGGTDLVTTTHPRTLPKGQNAEVIRADVLRALDERTDLDLDDREHVTRFIHQHPIAYRIENVSGTDPSLAETSLAVDTVDDLLRLERMSEVELDRLRHPILP